MGRRRSFPNRLPLLSQDRFGSTWSVLTAREYPKPGKPVYHWASIQEDLRRRDFTANAMAISLNEGSYGLLMDPLNGAADIEARTLRLVSNYGFLEEPALLIRATRYQSPSGLGSRPAYAVALSRTRNRRMSSNISPHTIAASSSSRSAHEDEGLKVLAALEAEGWMNILFPGWTAAKADEDEAEGAARSSAELQMQGVQPEMSAAQMQLLTAKLPAKDWPH